MVEKWRKTPIHLTSPLVQLSFKLLPRTRQYIIKCRFRTFYNVFIYLKVVWKLGKFIYLFIYLFYFLYSFICKLIDLLTQSNISTECPKTIGEEIMNVLHFYFLLCNRQLNNQLNNQKHNSRIKILTVALFRVC